MDFTALKTEFLARGFDYLSSTRQGQYVNRGYHWVCEVAQWSFLYATASGASPLTIADLREVRSVVDTVSGAQLEPSTFEDVRRIDPAVSVTGAPQYWYATSSTVVASWPTTAATLSVAYVKVPADLSAGADVAVVPPRYHLTIVDYAVKLAYEDSDNLAAAQALQQKIDVDVAKMGVDLMHREQQNARARAGIPQVSK